MINSKRSTSSWISMWTILGLSLILIGLFYVCEEMCRVKIANHTNPIYNAIPKEIVVTPIAVSVTDSSLQDSINKLNVNFSSRLLEIENINQKLTQIIFLLGDETDKLSETISAENNKINERLDSIDAAVFDNNENTNNRIDGLILDLKGIVKNTDSLREAVDENSKGLVDVNDLIKSQSKLIEEYKIKLEDAVRKIEENMRQIEDMKLMFNNYDLVIAIEKEKRNKK